ncbi:MAG TPA: PilZ domain-containing protein [Patescibacteria group bacterium]|nr:PilZ domain-containing protein [Patescibacteria group bacterium]
MTNVGLRIFPQINRPPQALINGFAGLPVANIADNMNRMSCLDAKIRPLNEVPLLGPAFTIKARPGDNLMLHRALDLARPGDILVIDAQGDLSNSIMGELMALWACKRGLGGFVVDGAVRDVGALKKMDIPIYAAGITPAGPYKDGPGEINVPVSCGGVVVHPGDILVGDEDGIVVINPQDAELLLEKTKAKFQLELKIMEDIDNLSWDRSWVEKTLYEQGVSLVLESRQWPRVEIFTPVNIAQIITGTEVRYEAMGLNISREGIMVQTAHPLNVGTQVELELPPELGGLAIVAKVLWENQNHFGCKFLNATDDILSVLDSTVERILRQIQS